MHAEPQLLLHYVRHWHLTMLFVLVIVQERWKIFTTSARSDRILRCQSASLKPMYLPYSGRPTGTAIDVSGYVSL